jgi:catechol 2,3-dioxygenase-like lactoylglutathione lyase family enzyme
LLTNTPCQATLPASDLQRASAFYEGKLGLNRATEQAPAGVGPGAVIYECGGSRFSVTQSSGAPSGTHTQLAWFVDDLVAQVEELRSKGVAFEEYDQPMFKTVGGIVEAPGVKAAWFKDTEGNLLGLVQVLL